MNRAPLISIIIPVHNVEKYLRKCVDSVLLQTYRNLEIILIDDGSTDTSSQICDGYAQKDARIVVIHKQNGGVSSARNAGLEVAKGRYIGFVDGDDCIASDMFATLLNLCQTYKTDISVCSVYNKPILLNGKIRCLSSSKALVQLAAQLYVCNKLFSREVIGNIRFRTDLYYCEDLMFCLQTFLNTSVVVYTNERKYYYRMNPNSATKQAFNLKKLNYFLSADEAKSFARDYHLGEFENCIRGEEAANAASFLADLISYDCPNKEQINRELLARVKKNIYLLLFSGRRLRNKLFAVVCCINLNLASKIYQVLKGNQ